jgi:hypothetical protein
MRVVAAFLDHKRLDIYFETEVDADVDAGIDQIAATLGLDDYRASSVVPLPVEPEVSPVAVAPKRQLASLRRGNIVDVGVSADGRTLTVRVRHKLHEQVDRVVAKETAERVDVSAWVGTPPDDPRGDYATLADAFSTARAELAQPVGTRRIIHDS